MEDVPQCVTSFEKDGVRKCWNMWPPTEADAHRLIVPVSIAYSPLKRIDDIPTEVNDAPRCECGAVLNPLCAIDWRTHRWHCPFCYLRPELPEKYKTMTRESRSLPLFPTSTTIEYISQEDPTETPIVLFCVDTSLEEEELSSVKSMIVQSLSLLREETRVGLLTFDSRVKVYGFKSMVRTYVFEGEGDYSQDKVKKMLDLHDDSTDFFLPVCQTKDTLCKILEEVVTTKHAGGERAARCTGTAISVALHVLDLVLTRGRIYCFIGGPATIGKGRIVSQDLKDCVRSHANIKSGTGMKLVNRALDFFYEVKERAILRGHSVNFLAASYDQTGLFEMKDVVNETGGSIVMCDEFNSDSMRNSFLRLMSDDGDDAKASDICIEVYTQKQFKVCGALGPIVSEHVLKEHVSSSEIGVAKTCVWKASCLDRRASILTFYEVCNKEPLDEGSTGAVQFVTTYVNSHGKRVTRVTTTTHEWAPAENSELYCIDGFDQELAAVSITRVALFKYDNESFDVESWIDRLLIKFCKRFSMKTKGEVVFNEMIERFPDIMFNLRKSPFISFFNMSPDETAYFRHLFNKVSIEDAFKMVRPSLLRFGFDGFEIPAVLDASSIQDDSILLLDTFFTLVVFHGSEIAEWKKLGYHEEEGYEDFADLLERPKAIAMKILEERAPVPRYIECVHGDSPSRHLLARLNPTISPEESSKKRILTDDPSFAAFLEKLKEQIGS